MLQRASSLRRVVTVAGGGLEGPLDASDFPALHVPLYAVRAHLCSLISLGLEAVAKMAPEVSFVHDYPGTVDTGLSNHITGPKGVIILRMMLRAYIYFLGRWVCVPIEESGERHLYLATSARYPPVQDYKSRKSAVLLGNEIEIAQGTTGRIGSGVYSVGWNGESLSPAVQKLLADLRDNGMVERIWQYTESEFKWITEQD